MSRETVPVFQRSAALAETGKAHLPNADSSEVVRWHYPVIRGG